MEPRLLKQMRGKTVIDMEEGRKVGVFEDLMIAPGDFRTAALITSIGGLLNRKLEGARAEDVRVWGHDVILVANPHVIRPKDDIAGLADTILASNVLKGRSVISLDGKRLGVADDFYINDHGMVEAVHLQQSISDGPQNRLRMIPISAVRSMGKDAIIVDMDRIVFAGNSADMDPQVDYDRILSERSEQEFVSQTEHETVNPDAVTLPGRSQFESELGDPDATIPSRSQYEQDLNRSGAEVYSPPEKR